MNDLTLLSITASVAARVRELDGVLLGVIPQRSQDGVHTGIACWSHASRNEFVTHRYIVRDTEAGADLEGGHYGLIAEDAEDALRAAAARAAGRVAEDALRLACQS